MKKRLLMLLTSAFLVMGIGACNKKSESKSSHKESSSSETSSSTSSSQSKSSSSSQGGSSQSSGGQSSSQTSSSSGGQSSSTQSSATPTSSSQSSGGQSSSQGSSSSGGTSIGPSSSSSEEPPVEIEFALYVNGYEQELLPNDAIIAEDGVTRIGDQFKSTLDLAADDLLTFFRNGEQIYPFASGDGNNAARDDGTGLLYVRTGGTNLDLYFKFYYEDSFNPGNPGYDVWLFGYEPPVVVNTFTVKINDGDATEATFDSYIEDEEHNVIGDQYKLTADLEAGDVITFFHNDTQIYPYATGDGNNAVRNNETSLLSVRTSGEDLDLYLKFYYEDTFNPGNPGYDVWLTGYVAPTPQPGEEQTFTVDVGPWDVDGAVFAAYVWAEGVDAAWLPFTDSVTINKVYSKMILVRLDPAGGVNWESKWNQTDDIDIDWTKSGIRITGWSTSNYEWID